MPYVGEQPRWEKRRNTQMAIALMILGNWWQSLGGARANDKKSAVFGTKQTFSDKKTTFRRFQVGVRLACVQFPPAPPLSFIRSSTMTRNKLFAAIAIISAVVLTACSDMTAPKSACPVINGSSVCLTK
jgi:hypothetical protein